MAVSNVHHWVLALTPFPMNALVQALTMVVRREVDPPLEVMVTVMLGSKPTMFEDKSIMLCMVKAMFQ